MSCFEFCLQKQKYFFTKSVDSLVFNDLKLLFSKFILNMNLAVSLSSFEILKSRYMNNLITMGLLKT